MLKADLSNFQYIECSIFLETMEKILDKGNLPIGETNSLFASCIPA